MLQPLSLRRCWRRHWLLELTSGYVRIVVFQVIISCGTEAPLGKLLELMLISRVCKGHFNTSQVVSECSRRFRMYVVAMSQTNLGRLSCRASLAGYASLTGCAGFDRWLYTSGDYQLSGWHTSYQRYISPLTLVFWLGSFSGAVTVIEWEARDCMWIVLSYAWDCHLSVHDSMKRSLPLQHGSSIHVTCLELRGWDAWLTV